jgi:hypothetical protein
MSQGKTSDGGTKELASVDEDRGGEKKADLQKVAKEAADIAETLPELYRPKAFEIIFSYLISGNIGSAPSTLQIRSQAPPESHKPVVRLEVKALLQQYSVPEDIVLSNFFVDGQIVSAYTLKDIEKMKTSRVQIVFALLTALETALKTGKFEFSVEEVRKKCRDSNRYDSGNFKNNFKYSKEFFTNPSDEETIELSSPGKTELADILLELVK